MLPTKEVAKLKWFRWLGRRKAQASSRKLPPPSGGERFLQEA